MKEVIKKYNVYQYDELNEQIKINLLEKEVENCINDYCELSLEEDMKYKADELLKNVFGKNATLNNVYYDLSYCQGSGAMVEFSGSYCGKNFIVKNTGRYSHAYSFIIESEQDFTDKQEQLLKDKIININTDLGNYGYKLIEPENFTDLALEQLKEKTFLENGTFFE